ncbi:ChaN family lipoprotein [Rugamonas sp.]|uniref:ChaN family lipoprotein n=1 Tax=Rugamonas sp. TaxID=1926287 RepID=UPI0025E4E72B|nr:ChaN family lipoprotein [Rugamonas sp.]
MTHAIHPPAPAAMSSMIATMVATLALAALAALSGCAGKKPAAPPVAAAPEANPQVLLLGEVHDNSQGQRLRFEELRRRVEAGWRPAIAMEQFDRESQPLLDEAQKGCIDAACMIQVVGGPKWDWQQYYPLIDMAISYRLPLIAANLSRADASRVVRNGVASAFDAAAVADYHLAQPLPADIRSGQQREIVQGHCGMLSDSMVGGMVDAQVARDIWMARLILAQRPRDVVLIAGNGHVRKDIGVARWLAVAAPALTVRSIAYLEGDAAAPAGAYDATRKLAALTRPDPCAALKAGPAK